MKPQLPSDVLPHAAGRPICLSAAQRRLWVLHQLQPEDASLNRPLAIRLTGPLDVEAVEWGLAQIVRRHHVLRTVFFEIEGNPAQVVLPFEPLRLASVDLCSLPLSEREAEAKRIAARESQKPFDLAQGPLLRPVVLRLGEQQHVLFLSMPHIIFDGWSEAILVRELSTHYEAFMNGAKASPLPDLPIQYVDFAVWQQRRLARGELNASVEYWKRQLAEIEPLALPIDFTRERRADNQGAKHSFMVSPSLTDQLNQLSRAEGVTLFMTLLAAFQLLLSRYSGQGDIAVGVPIAGRATLETEDLIGCFMNILVLRAALSGNSNFREALARTQNIALEAYANQETPLERVVEELRPERLPGRWPLFQVLFNFKNLEAARPRAGNIRIDPFSFDSGFIGGLDLSFGVTAQPDGLHCAFNYPSALFRTETIQRMAQHFRTLLEAIVAEPAQRISDLSLVTAEERQRLVSEWSDTARSYGPDVGVHELFEEQVKRTPGNLAVVFKDEQLTYAELNARANQVAHYLCKWGVGRGTRVGICLEKSLAMPIAILAVLKAGGAYIPIEPLWPEERIDFILANAGASVVATQGKWRGPWNPSSAWANERTVILLDRDRDVIAEQSQLNPTKRIFPENLAYVIYTSGSTGQPKGVMISHGGISNYLRWRCEFFPLMAEDRVLQRSAFSFDDSGWEFFEPWMVGATLVCPEPDSEKDLGYLLRLIDRRKVTAACFIPSQLEALLEHPEFGKCRSLRRLTTGAETLTAELRDRVLDRLGADFYNGYGPTEATIGATFSVCQKGVRDGSLVPIGRPIANTQVYILDDRLQPVPVGVPGELFIGGYGLARGYLGCADSTAERFLPNPFSNSPGERLYRTGDRGRYLADGNIEFLGRLDDQVKLRGFRIELGEVESILKQHPGVKEAVAAVVDVASYDKRLIAYVVPKQEAGLLESGLQVFLSKRLPAYMVPSAIVLMDRLPRTLSGKIDRRALAESHLNSRPHKESHLRPRTPTEEILAQLWSELLGVSPIGIQDNFFSLGGHSLSAIRLISRLHGALKLEVPLCALFENPTIEALARFIDEQAREKQISSIVAELEVMSDAQAKAMTTTSKVSRLAK